MARIRGLSAAAVFCDLVAAHNSVVRQYVVGTDLPKQRLLVLMDILGLNPVQWSELVAFLQTEFSLLKSACLEPRFAAAGARHEWGHVVQVGWYWQGHGHGWWVSPG